VNSYLICGITTMLMVDDFCEIWRYNFSNCLLKTPPWSIFPVRSSWNYPRLKPHNLIRHPLSNPTKLKMWMGHETPQNAHSFLRMAQGIRFYGALVFQNFVKFIVFGGHCRYLDEGEIWRGWGRFRAKFHPHQWNVSPLRGKKIPKLTPCGQSCRQRDH